TRASAMFLCGELITSTCGCRNSGAMRPSVAAVAASKNACGTSTARSLVAASTKKYSSSIPNVNVPAMRWAPRFFTSTAEAKSVALTPELFQQQPTHFGTDDVGRAAPITPPADRNSAQKRQKRSEV